MKNEHSSEKGDYRSLLILDEISKNKELTQLELSNKLGLAVGLVNSYIKNLVSKGYITVSTIPRRRYLYYLTPRGFVEQTRLTYQHLSNFTNLYRVARKDFHELFNNLKEKSGIERVGFCGVDEVTEIAFLSLSEAGLKLVGVFNDEKLGKNFFGHEVLSLEEVSGIECEVFVITRFRGGDVLAARLIELGIERERIIDLSRDGWLKKFDN